MNDTSHSSSSDLPQQSHVECFACGPANGCGLGLQFQAIASDVVEASFPCESVFAGYPGMLHGGVICTLLDGAMTNCLFAQGLAALTVDMQIRFHRPVVVSQPAMVRAWLTSKRAPIHRLAAELCQAGQVMATATARFVDKQAVVWLEQTRK